MVVAMARMVVVAVGMVGMAVMRGAVVGMVIVAVGMVVVSRLGGRRPSARNRR